MNGYEATEQIRKKEAGVKHISIIAVTANAMMGAAGMDDYVARPVNRETLEKAVNAWL